MRYRAGPCEDGRCFAVFAMRIGEKERFGGCESFVENAAFADEAVFERHAVVDMCIFSADESVGFDIDADTGPAADRAVFKGRRTVDRHVVADADFADEPCPDDAAVAAHFAHLRSVGFGVCFGHAFERGDELRTMAIDRHQISDLRRQVGRHPDRPACAFVDGRYADAIAERAASAAFQCGNILDERIFADPVVPDARAPDAGAGCQFDRAFKAALLQLRRVEVVVYDDLRPCFGRDACCFERGDFGCGRISQSGHLLFAVYAVKDTDKRRDCRTAEEKIERSPHI